MNAIVVVDKNWGIGKDNGLLVHLPGDLKYFKEKTLGKILIMGRKTLESLPGGRPLPGRTTVVLSADTEYEDKLAEKFPEETGATLFACSSEEDLTLLLLQLEFTTGLDLEEDVFVAGGAKVYSMMLPYCSRFYVTKIKEAYEADCHFPDLDKMVSEGLLSLADESEPMEEKGISYSFLRYDVRQ